MCKTHKNIVEIAAITLNLGKIKQISHVDGGIINHVYRIEFFDGKILFAKHAGDLPKSDTVGQTLLNISADRLLAEKRALILLNNIFPVNVEVPEVIHYDNRTHTLFVSEVCQGGTLLDGELKNGKFDLKVAKQIGLSMMQCHSDTKGIYPLRGSKENDIKHWDMMLSLRTTDIPNDTLPVDVISRLQELRKEAALASRNQLMHLDFCPKNILAGESTIGIIDFELSSSYGDLAYDLGFFLAHYMIWGIETGNLRGCKKAIEAILIPYVADNKNYWDHISKRVVGFTGATILYRLFGASPMNVIRSRKHLQRTGTALLSPEFDTPKSALKRLSDAAAGFYA